MAAQPRPKPQRTQPCANKLWKKAMKAYWRWEVFAPNFTCDGRGERLYQGAMKLCKRAGIDPPERLALLVKHGISTGFPYGKKGYSLKMYEFGWWHPPTEWDWVWASVAAEFVPAIRRRQTKDPARLP